MEAERHSVSSPRTFRVLCVDDHAPGLKIRKILLECFGYSVQTAASGREALGLVTKNDFDVVVLDYRMPGMNGLELARALRQHSPSLPLIVLSGLGSELPVEMGELASAVVAKGSPPGGLVEKLAEVLGATPRPKRRPPRADADELRSRTQKHLEESKRQIQKAQGAASRGRKGRRSA